MGVFQDIQTDIELASVKMVTEYRRRLLVDALKLCGNEVDAEDLVSSVFNEIFAHDDGYDPKKGELYPYLRGILEHLYARTKRRAVNRGTVAVEPFVLAQSQRSADQRGITHDLGTAENRRFDRNTKDNVNNYEDHDQRQDNAGNPDHNAEYLAGNFIKFFHIDPLLQKPGPCPKTGAQ